jgi:hypothetical protein
MYVPANVPVKVGHAIRVTLGGAAAPELSKPAEESLDAMVVRVDRHALLTLGQAAVGVKFEAKS